jgi:hypothetical protein
MSWRFNKHGKLIYVTSFSGEEMYGLALLAHRRLLVKNDPYGSDRIKVKDTFESHLLGCMAEAAVARLLHLKPAVDITPTGDGGSRDLVLSDGRSISVKYSRWRPAEGFSGPYFALRGTSAAEFKDTYGVLCIPAWDGCASRIEVAGWLDRDVIDQHGTLVNFGYGERLAVPLDKMHAIKDFPLLKQKQEDRCVCCGADVSRDGGTTERDA